MEGWRPACLRLPAEARAFKYSQAPRPLSAPVSLGINLYKPQPLLLKNKLAQTS